MTNSTPPQVETQSTILHLITLTMSPVYYPNPTRALEDGYDALLALLDNMQAEDHAQAWEWLCIINGCGLPRWHILLRAPRLTPKHIRHCWELLTAPAFVDVQHFHDDATHVRLIRKYMRQTSYRRDVIQTARPTKGRSDASL